MKKNLIYILTTLVVLLFDQITKYLAVIKLDPLTPYKVIGDWLRFTLVYNKNAAFSVSYATPTIRTIVMGAATLFVIIYIIYSIKKGEKFSYIFCLSMILGGAFGNLIDRIRMGQVVDFIQMGIAPKNLYWPVYNIADSFVVIGVSLMLIFQLLRKNNDNNS